MALGSKAVKIRHNEKVWECAEESLTAEEFNTLLLATEGLRMTGWHWAAERRNLNILQNVRAWAEGS